jgi:hypothetical protein
LAKTVAKGVSTVRKLTRELKEAGVIEKKKQLQASLYLPGFIRDLSESRGLFPLRPLTIKRSIYLRPLRAERSEQIKTSHI